MVRLRGGRAGAVVAELGSFGTSFLFKDCKCYVMNDSLPRYIGGHSNISSVVVITALH